MIQDSWVKGIAAAKARGVYKGRPQSVDYDTNLQLKSQGLGVNTIAVKMRYSRETVHKALGEA